MNLACPECSTVYRIDPSRVPEAGVGARCRACGTVFRVEPHDDDEPGAVRTAAPVPAVQEAPGTPATPEVPAEPAEPSAPQQEPEAAPSAPRSSTPPGAPAAPAFGPQDPQTRAKRLARALVSDIKVYNPDKWARSKAEGTMRKEFRDEILKSWEEYVEQVGPDMAKKTPFFRDALNDILTGGERLF